MAERKTDFWLMADDSWLDKNAEFSGFTFHFTDISFVMRTVQRKKSPGDSSWSDSVVQTLHSEDTNWT